MRKDTYPDNIKTGTSSEVRVYVYRGTMSDTQIIFKRYVL